VSYLAWVLLTQEVTGRATVDYENGTANIAVNYFCFSQERLMKRREYFEAMDSSKKGYISFHEWLEYAYNHIVKKVAGI
jgi:ppGpp synthetase/RelA/SpoT-type nucleotidyltranferase